MEFINKVELRGVVGRSVVTPAGEHKIVRFSLLTEYAYRTADSNLMETQWHNVFASDSVTKDLDGIKKGAWVEVKGRIRSERYTDSEGQNRIVPQVVATEVNVVRDAEE